MSNTVVGIDCDGTIFKHEYPQLGEPIPGAMEWMRKFIEAGAKLVLFTMRDKKTMIEGFVQDSLAEPIAECRKHGVEFWGVNENPTQKEWTHSPKCWANIYIDDHGVCTPLIGDGRGRQYVDWSIVGPAAMQIIEARKRRGDING